MMKAPDALHSSIAQLGAKIQSDAERLVRGDMSAGGSEGALIPSLRFAKVGDLRGFM